MNIAIVGSGIAGLRCAQRLHKRHEVTVYEAAPWIGGHAHTVRVDLADETQYVDTGFVVFNERTYPRFTAMLAELGVPTQPTDMSFAVTCTATGIAYKGSARGLAARPRQLARREYRSMLRDLWRFNRSARAFVSADACADREITVEDFLATAGLSDAFARLYLVPLGAAIWSADPVTFPGAPARALLRFLDNHGLLRFRGRPQWRTVVGGAQRYVNALVAPFRERVRIAKPVEKIVRRSDGVEVMSPDGVQRYDQVVLAVHSDEALELLADPTPAERSVLGSLRYQANTVVLHTDISLLPSRRALWASWNVHRRREPERAVAVTYDMTRLQRLSSARRFLVTLNRDDAMAPESVIGRWTYAHPVYDLAALAARGRRQEISGSRRTWFAGAYWGDGFHEDALVSADWVADRLLASGP